MQDYCTYCSEPAVRGAYACSICGKVLPGAVPAKELPPPPPLAKPLRLIYLALVLGWTIGLARHPPAVAILFTYFVFSNEMGCVAALVAGIVFNLRVEEFAIGLGSPALVFRVGNTVVRLNWVLVGGYVKMAGTQSELALKGDTKHIAFEKLSISKRIAAALACPLFVFISAVCLLGLHECNRLIHVLVGSLSPSPGATAARLLPKWSAFMLSLPSHHAVQEFFLVAFWVGLANLIPLPLSAGGNAVLILLEQVFGKKIATRVMSILLLPNVAIWVYALWLIGALMYLTQYTSR